MLEAMVRLARGFITQEVRDLYAQLQREETSNDGIAQFIWDQFFRLNLDKNQFFFIFELLVSWRPNFENPENSP